MGAGDPTRPRGELIMGWRFRQSLRILPEVRLNISKREFSSVRVGRRAATRRPETEEERVDRTYKQDIPSVIKRLEQLRDEFAIIDSKTDWIGLRIKPLLEHAQSLDRLIRARPFARETARLTRGVRMFHADLVYFRENLRELTRVLESERQRATEHP
jgi:Protein of unknown function (DUF4236)